MTPSPPRAPHFRPQKAVRYRTTSGSAPPLAEPRPVAGSAILDCVAGGFQAGGRVRTLMASGGFWHGSGIHLPNSGRARSELCVLLRDTLK